MGHTPRYFLIDEITAVSDWQRGIKWLRDNTPVASDCVVVTGSSANDVAGGTFHLAGRRGPDINLDRLLLPMSFPQFVRCAGYSMPVPPKLSFAALYTEDGRVACNDALVHMGTLIDAFDAYLQIGGFPQAVTDFRRDAMVSPGFTRDLWDVIRSDLHRQGISRPEQCLSLLERIAASLASRLSMQTVADTLDIDRRTASSWIDTLANSYLLLVVFKERKGVPDVNSLRKIYPIDPAIAHLPSRYAPGVGAPDETKLAEAVLAMTIFRSVEGNAIDRFCQPGRLFYFRSANDTEIDYLVLPDRKAAESKYIETPDRRELQGLLANFGEGLLLTHSAVDIVPNGTILPAAVFAWLLEQGD